MPFKVVDQTHVEFKKAFQPFAGGARLHSLGDLTAAQAPMAADQYLQQLPVAVIRNGRVINVRADVEALLKAPPPPPNCSAAVDTTTRWVPWSSSG